MAVSAVAAQLARRGDMLMSGQIETLLASYVFPLPVFLEERLLLLRSCGQARAVLDHLRGTLTARGVARLQAKVTAVELPRAGRYRVWIDWQEISGPFDCTGVASAVYYCRETADGPRIEMVNYTRLAHPALDRQFQGLALTA